MINYRESKAACSRSYVYIYIYTFITLCILNQLVLEQKVMV